MDINNKEDKKKPKKYDKNSETSKAPIGLRKNEKTKKQILYKLLLEQSDNSSKSQNGKLVITYSKDSSSGDKKDKK